MDYAVLSKDFIKLHKFVTLMEYVMFVNSKLLLIKMSRGIKFVMVKQIPTRTAKQLSKYLK